MHISILKKAIKDRRKVLDINQEQLSELTGIGLRTIKGLESGKSNPTLKTVETILNVLGLELMIKTKK
ncbi:helix-turn-helix domain-containing protein [Saprospiraceae bacterium]|nr:helix-turn-helix domain-containing protein [Saprospiraceae bacterium]